LVPFGRGRITFFVAFPFYLFWFFVPVDLDLPTAAVCRTFGSRFRCVSVPQFVTFPLFGATRRVLFTRCLLPRSPVPTVPVFVRSVVTFLTLLRYTFGYRSHADLVSSVRFWFCTLLPLPGSLWILRYWLGSRLRSVLRSF